MRRAALLLGPVLALITLFACEDSGSSSGGSSAPDGAAFESGSTDGARADAPIDPADGADAPIVPQVVTVHVVGAAGAPAAGVTVVFHDAAGSVTETKATGADGRATSSLGSLPSMASVLLGGGNLRRIVTWTTALPGDELFARDVGMPSASGSYSVALPGTLTDAGETSANADIGVCSASAVGTNVLVPLTTECMAPTTAILARAVALSGGELTIVGLAFAKGKAAAPTDGGTASAAVGPWKAPGSMTVTPMNLPQTNAFVGLQEIADNLAFPNQTGGSISATNGKATFQIATGFADAVQAGLRVSPNATPGSTLTIAKRVAPASNIDLDFAAPLPALESATLTTTTIKRPQVEWTTVASAPLTATDGGSVSIHWSDTGAEDKGWTFIVAPGAKTVTAPSMPLAADAWIPRATTDAGSPSSFYPPEVTFIEADVLADYAAFRREIGRIIPLAYTSNRDARAVLPANGTLKATSFMDVPQ